MTNKIKLRFYYNNTTNKYRYAILINGIKCLQSCKDFNDIDSCKIAADWVANKLGWECTS